MSQKFEGSFFSIQYPETWDLEIIENVPCFYDPDSGWALQIASSRSPFSIDLLSEIENYMIRQGLSFDEESVVPYELSPEIQAVASEYYVDNRFWLINMFCFENKLIVFLFNSDESPDAELAREIAACIRSLQFYSEE